MRKITAQEVELLELVDDAITSALLRVDSVRLRRYLRNWTTELINQEKEKRPFVRQPRKK